ncbi:MAG: translocation/assembly module TamB [Muribaculaceae bacterium]|nr:translocation/assembly module TamB [Muribaculaceae bacterium]
MNENIPTPKPEDTPKAEEAMVNDGTTAKPSANPDSDTPQPEGEKEEGKKKKKHFIRPKWLRIVLRVILCLIIFILLIPVLLYLPPVQNIIKNVACDMVYKSTGMKISIDKFLLKWPLDVELDKVLVIDANKDTMVNARQVIADVKLRPLLNLDVQLNGLRLLDGEYRMMSPDSSMILKIKAGRLDVDSRSYANIRTSEICLNKGYLRDGNLQLYMNVWKQQNTPPDSTSASTPFFIKANDLHLENFTFGMSMLPTIDTLKLTVNDLRLREGVIDLRENSVKWKLATIKGGEATYLTPTPEWVKQHPAPPSQPSSGPPMVIMGDSISLDNFKALYATKGVKPLPGFDASYIQVSDVAIGLKDFYNESSTIRLPITRLEATERSGLKILNGSGTIGVDSIGLTLDDVAIRTIYSTLTATADVPFAMMQMKPDAQTSVKAKASIGLPDVDAFMPSLRAYTSKIPARNPLMIDLAAEGSLSDVEIARLDVSLKEVLELNAKGYAKNPLDMKKLKAYVDFDGRLSNPALIGKFVGTGGIKIPTFSIKGNASADRDTYTADFNLLSSAGDLAADGRVSLNSERYDVDATLRNINVAQFVPDLGIGHISGKVKANGSGFNPINGKAYTNADILISAIEYNRRHYNNIKADVVLNPNGSFTLYATSPNPGLDFEIDGTGSIHPDNYTFDISADIRDLDLRAIGLTDSVNNGYGRIYLNGSASPDRWLYDARVDLSDFEWNLPGQTITIPGSAYASIYASTDFTEAHIDSDLTYLDFESQSGLKRLIDRFTNVSGLVMKQVEERNLAVDSISRLLPPFDLTFQASGRGLLNQILTPYDMRLDTVYATLTHDSLLRGDIGATNFSTSSLSLDTLTLNLNERRNLLDYKIHLGNRPGTLDEFAQVNLNGYIGQNRIAASLTQQNLKKETGYRIGLTAAMMDSTISVHFTPLKSTIAYMPWTFNNDNYIDCNIFTKRIQANLMAASEESSILLKTEPLPDGSSELLAKIDKLKIQDFLNMALNAPPITGELNTDLRVKYDKQRFSGNGTIDLNNLTYDRTRIGSFNLDLDAAYALSGNTDVTAGLRIDGNRALEAYASLRPDANGVMEPDSLGVRLTSFPIAIANPFLNNMAVLAGSLNGDMRLDGTFTKPLLNGYIAFDKVTARIPMAGSTLKFTNDSVTVKSNIIDFNKFNIFGQNENPLTLDGQVDATSFSDISFDLSLIGKNFQPVGNDNRAHSDLYGKLFLDLDAGVKGNMSRMDINANLNVLGTSDVTYVVSTAAAAYTGQTENDVVKFVNFNDTTQVAESDSITGTMNMRINAKAVISPGTQITVLLPAMTGGNNATDRVELQPTANLTFFQNYMGDMRLNGNFILGEGFARYSIPVVGQKKFEFNPQSSVTWSGDLMNPSFNIMATDEMKANVSSGGNSRLVNFLVTLKAVGNLNNPQVSFDLSTNDDLSIQNELQSMSADQRQTQAMNLLLYGQYVSGDTKANANLGGNLLYSFLESQLNSWAAKTIRGVDLSFGIDQYDKLSNGASSTETSYSYQVSKSLFNNRFKIQVGGNYSTDASADENLEQNLVSDISLEYILRQTQTTNMAVRLFRHTGYESILEGEVTETGAGFVMKRKLDNLLRMFRFLMPKKKRKRNNDSGGNTIIGSPMENDTIKTSNEKSDK